MRDQEELYRNGGPIADGEARRDKRQPRNDGQTSRGAAFDAAGQRYDAPTNELSVKQGNALTPEERAKARRVADPEAGAVNRRYKEGRNRQERFKLSAGAAAGNQIGRVGHISEKNPDFPE
jgi:hypothetical protein